MPRLAPVVLFATFLVLLACSSADDAPAEGEVDVADVRNETVDARDVVADAALAATTIEDESLAGQRMVAVTVDVPSNWKTEGGVFWDRSSDCVGNHMRLKWRASSADAQRVFEIMPGYTWQLQGTELQMNPCPSLPVQSPRQFLEIVAQRYPGARIVEYRDRPDLSKPTSPGQYGGTARIDGGELVISYVQGDTTVRESLTTMLNVTELQGNVVIGVPAVYAMRSSNGDIDAKLGDQIRASMRPDPQWMALVQQTSAAVVEQVSHRQRAQIAAWHAREMGRINARGAMERSQIAMQTSREVAQIYSDTWANSQATDDRIQRRTLEAIGSYNTYANPKDGVNVRESIDYDRVLRTQSGDYISTNDPNYNPAGTEELERVR